MKVFGKSLNGVCLVPGKLKQEKFDAFNVLITDARNQNKRENFMAETRKLIGLKLKILKIPTTTQLSVIQKNATTIVCILSRDSSWLS